MPTLIGDELHGLLSCPAAPLVAGSLQRRSRQVRLAPVPRHNDPLAPGEALLYLATCPQQGGNAAGIAAAVAPDDKLTASIARSAVEEWAAAGSDRMLLAAASPWCSGAIHAASMSREAAASHDGSGKTIRILGPTALPPETVTELRGRGAVPVSSLADAEEGDVVVFPAHGVTNEIRSQAADRGLIVIDATCPLVAQAQEIASRYASRGQHLVLIGPQDAAATTPIAGRTGGNVTLVENVAGTTALDLTDARRISYLLQPGMSVEAAQGIVAALRSRFPAATSTQPGGLCYAASDRASGIRAVATGSDIVLVAGNPQSADARQLAAQARESDTRVQIVGAVEEITPAMLTGVTTIGVAESTSARAGLAENVITAISGLGLLKVARRQVSTELVDIGPDAALADADAELAATSS